MARIRGFVQDTKTDVTQFLQIVDRWSSKEQENNAMGYATSVTQADVDAVFGTHLEGVAPNEVVVSNVTKAQYQAALTAMQTLINSVHVPATAAKLYILLNP